MRVRPIRISDSASVARARRKPTTVPGSLARAEFDDGAETPPSGRGGRRDREEFDKIITLYVAAAADLQLQGPDIVVAAEKAGLSYGYMNIFHRLVDGRSGGGPVFNVANIKKPGSFEMAEIQALETPAIAFFLTLAGADSRAGCVGKNAAHRAAHGRTAGRRGAGRIPQCPRSSAHRA